VNDVLDLLWILILIQIFVPYLQNRLLVARRLSVIRRIEREHRSRVITMIHRQETLSLLGFPLRRYIDVEDSEQVLRAIRLTPDDVPIGLVLHTPGGLVLASEQIASALKRHKGKVTVFVPHYAMSGGTLVALAADEIVMDPDAVLGAVDPQLGDERGGYYPAASILKALEEPNPNRDDQTLILGDVARKAVTQVFESVYQLIKDKMPEDQARYLANALSDGRWTHDYPITLEQAERLGLPVCDGVPAEIYDLMDLYPQSGQRRPSVEYIPTPYAPPTRAWGGTHYRDEIR
jgi:ClpP class serine protease